MKHLLSLLIVFALVIFAPAVLAEDAAQVTLSLDANPSTGYVWTVQSSDEAVAAAEDLGFTEYADAEPLGSAGFSQFRLYGLKEGTAEVTLSYARPSGESETDIVFSFPVRVDAALNLAVDGELELPCEADSECSWYVSMRASILQFDVLSTEGSIRLGLIPDAEGQDTLHFIYTPENQAGAKWIIDWEASTQGKVLTLSSMAFQFPWMHPAGELTFETTDLDGNTVTEQIFSEATLTILNFWEPWCGPCVNEMPFLQKLSEEYADRGVQVIGIYATPNSEEEVAAILERTGVTYPILHYTNEFDPFQTGYVPTNIVIDSSGSIVFGPASGAMNYAGWCALVEDLL